MFLHLKAGRVARSFPRLQPGPDAYNLQTSLLFKHDFNRGESRMFRPPLVVKKETQKSENPAPNQYNVCGIIDYSKYYFSN